MRIGQLAERTGSSTRALRYYERNGLITAERLPNGYRDFSEDDVDRVIQIRGLLDAGIPVKIIEQMLPCLDGSDEIYVPEPEVLALLEEQLERMTRKAECLLANRDAIAAYLRRARGRDTEGPGPLGR